MDWWLSCLLRKKKPEPWKRRRIFHELTACRSEDERHSCPRRYELRESHETENPLETLETFV